MKLVIPEGSKVKKVAEGAILAASVYTTGKGLHDQYSSWRHRRGYLVTIEPEDTAFQAVSRKLVRLLPPGDQHRLQALTIRQEWPLPAKVVAAHEASMDVSVTIGGFPVTISRGEGGGRKGGQPAIDSTDSLASLIASAKTPPLNLWTRTVEGRDAILKFITEAVREEEKSSSGPKVWVATRWNDWATITDMPQRHLKSVVLGNGMVDDIVTDLKRFLEQEETYVELGLPWHRGYLFHGPPGTGKTSIVKAIASHFGLDLYAVALGDVSDDTVLGNLLRSVQPRSALLLEDIDTVYAANDRALNKPGGQTEGKKGVSLSGLLNALDGVATPHGLVTFMTTNYRERLDSALLRPGRSDRTFKIDYLDDEQLHRLVAVFTGLTPNLPNLSPDAQVAPASIVELLKENLDEPGRFVEELVKRLEDKDYEWGT